MVEKERYAIGVDARPLSTSISGVGRVIAETIKSFPEKDRYMFYLFTHRPIHPSHSALLDLPNVVVFQTKGFFALKGGIYFNFFLPYFIRKQKLDLFWGSQQVIPPFLPKNLPVVITFYDLVSYFFPGTMRKIAVFQQRLFQKLSINRADFIISISEQTRNDMIEMFQFDRKKTAVAYPGIDFAEIQKCILTPTPPRVQNIQTPYYLTVSTIEPRKNYPFLFKVYEEYLKRVSGGPKFTWVIAGKIGWESQEFLEEFRSKINRDTSIVHIDSPSDIELHHIYKKADLFLFASVYEGFGIPLVEALLHGKYSIVSDIPTFREIGEDKITYLPLNDPGVWVDAILQFQKKPKKIKFDPNKFTWKKSSEITKNIFERFLKK